MILKGFRRSFSIDLATFRLEKHLVNVKSNFEILEVGGAQHRNLHKK